MAQPSSKISPLGNYREQPNKAYISTRPFDSNSNTTGTLFTYSTSLNGNFQTVGSLQFNTNATAPNCPRGRLLHLNGKMLIPGVHPGGAAGVNPSTGSTTGGTPATLPFPLVGVYDPVSGLNGYINPQDTTWGSYDATLGATYDLGLANPDSTLAGNGTDNDQPALPACYIPNGLTTVIGAIATGATSLTITKANMTLANGVVGKPQVGQTIYIAGGFVAGETITAINETSTTYVLTLSGAATGAGVAADAAPLYLWYSGTQNTYAGTVVPTPVTAYTPATNATITVTNPNVKADSIILLSYSRFISGLANTLSISGQVDGSFRITQLAGGSATTSLALVNYQIIN
jgi:hypothetical protein